MLWDYGHHTYVYFYSEGIAFRPLSDSFEYLSYGSTTIINITTLTVRGRQILTSKDDPRAAMVKVPHNSHRPSPEYFHTSTIGKTCHCQLIHLNLIDFLPQTSLPF